MAAGEGETEYLFDLVLDPGERRDRKDAEPARSARLRDLYLAWNAQMLPPA